MTTAPAPTPAATRTRIARLAASRITLWQEGYLRDQAHHVAALARLRRGAGRPASAMPDLWSLVDTGPLHEGDDDHGPLNELELTRAEGALYTALTLWALHQQSRPARMHRPHQPEQPRGLGYAVRNLMPAGGIDEPALKRLVRAGTAPDLTVLSQRLRDLVVLLRRSDIPLDYGLLAGQLYTWQWPGGADAVRRDWGRSFHSRPRTPGADPARTDTHLDPDDKDAS
ncbi:type I-E CRISPR-associated protein Cse2/CasB [Streptomyces sp. V3I7]|uniref:type I-E CRISPR-associated protein Cse2/CasB n=1 Tax=Streptomyces sp. V3I7 TaxID=3042278 RepID=UPI00277E8741|nr:type I-E CRISPR-associated protein Cse2/CasB [Streptomyces sp. V3I7]MDQ0994747.1 CRISPR system Cascade subunit CasB [Streptomyces sp. V3I7]